VETGVPQHLVGLPEAGGEHRHDLPGHRRIGTEELLELAAGQDQEPQVGLGHHGGGAPSPVEEGQLPEEVGGGQVGQEDAVAEGPGCALDDDEELTAHLILDGQRLSGRSLVLGGQGRQLLELCGGAVREQLDATKQGDPLVLVDSHRHG